MPTAWKKNEENRLPAKKSRKPLRKPIELLSRTMYFENIDFCTTQYSTIASTTRNKR